MSEPEPVLRMYLLEAAPASLQRLRELLPDHVGTPLGLEIPLREHAPEEILSLCLRLGVTARATRIVNRPRSG